MSQYQTLASPFEIRGIGLHSGQEVRLTVHPDPRPGWHFVRLDLPGAPEIEACLENVAKTQHATVLQSGEATVSTTEHLLAALWALGVTHARIELDGPEVPIVDGSALPFVTAIQAAGLQIVAGDRPRWTLNAPVWWEGGGASVLGLPHDVFRLSVAVNFDHLHAGAQSTDVIVNGADFARELAAARTFTLDHWLEPLRAAGLIKGGSLDNAVVVSESGLSSAPRFENEMARHKALDVVGDLALLFGKDGGEFCGHIIAIRAGHGPHRSWMEICRNSGALLRF
ncbi:UDP-3-O-[3-hydroxymyristoyl] N-acetylglucosamine deacetylase [bacterium]|nr:MAG: UDP-3-O-[3-hydroxymyristoyl] N-acetylglucosamine deacetylase [bacterium]